MTPKPTITDKKDTQLQNGKVYYFYEGKGNREIGKSGKSGNRGMEIWGHHT